jgi:1,4-dihydroxy-2-naphthoyl-CoA synthase
MAPPPTLQTIEIARLSPGAVLFSYNQPKISNAFTLQQYHDLADALIWAREESEIKVVVQQVNPSQTRCDSDEGILGQEKDGTIVPGKCYHDLVRGRLLRKRL